MDAASIQTGKLQWCAECGVRLLVRMVGGDVFLAFFGLTGQPDVEAVHADLPESVLQLDHLPAQAPTKPAAPQSGEYDSEL